MSQAFLTDERALAFNHGGINRRSTEESNSPKITLSVHKHGHVPPFLSIDLGFEKENPKDKLEEKVNQLRRADRERDPTNAALLKERLQNPHDIKWQFTPLLEARIFLCHNFLSK